GFWQRNLRVGLAAPPYSPYPPFFLDGPLLSCNTALSRHGTGQHSGTRKTPALFSVPWPMELFHHAGNAVSASSSSRGLRVRRPAGPTESSSSFASAASSA